MLHSPRWVGLKPSTGTSPLYAMNSLAAAQAKWVTYMQHSQGGILKFCCSKHVGDCICGTLYVASSLLHEWQRTFQ